MRRYSGKRKKIKRIPLTTCLPAPRTCLNSLPLPISRSCLFHPLLRPAVISPPCLQPCAEKLQVCHCVNDNYCTRESCSNSNSCKRSNPYLCSHRFKDNESLNTETANGNEARDAQELADNNTLDKINFDENSELYQKDGEERIPLQYSLSNTKDNSDTESNILYSQRADQPSSRTESKDGIYKNLTANRLTNKDYITSNTSNLPVLAKLVSDRDMNSRNSDSGPIRKNIADPKTIRDDNRAPNEMSLIGLHQTKFQRHLQPTDLNESLEPSMYNSRGTSTTQFDKSKSRYIHSEKCQTKNDASNQCCLPPYIQTAPATVDTSGHVEHTPRSRTQAQSVRHLNNSNENKELNENSEQGTYKSMTKSRFELNENDDSLSMAKTKEAIESTHNNKQNQALQISPPYEETIREFSPNDNTVLSGSTIKTISKAGCCKTHEKSGKKIEDSLHHYEFNNKYHSGYRPNQTKSIQNHKNQMFASNYNNIDLYDSGTKLSNLQGSDCCGQRLFGIGLRKDTNRESEYKSNKVVQKSKGVDCACSDYYEHIIPDEKGIKCKKNIACSREINSSACASVSCVMNQVPRCRCHYPPSFKQFHCVGHITGNCNCTDNN